MLPPTKWEISDLVKRLRTRCGLSQEGLAVRLGVAFGSVNRWENCKVKPSRLAMKRIANFIRATGKDNADLLSEARKMTPL